MAKSIDDRRRYLSKVIYSKESPFTVDQIIQEFRAEFGDCVIDGFESIRGFIHGLVDYDGLRPVNGSRTTFEVIR